MYKHTKLIIILYSEVKNVVIQVFYSYELRSLEIVGNPVPIIENYIATNIQTKCNEIYFGNERSFFERRHNSIKFDGAFG